jgi:hypothetical protein
MALISEIIAFVLGATRPLINTAAMSTTADPFALILAAIVELMRADFGLGGRLIVSHVLLKYIKD